MRLIDAEALENDIAQHWGEFYPKDGAVIERIHHAPTIDAEQVVRCKDCDYCKRYNDVWRFPKRDELVCTLYVETYDTTENDYCSRGERREHE